MKVSQPNVNQMYFLRNQKFLNWLFVFADLKGRFMGKTLKLGRFMANPLFLWMFKLPWKKLCVIYPLCFLNCRVLTPAEIDDYLAEGIDIVFFASSGVLPCMTPIEKLMSLYFGICLTQLLLAKVFINSKFVELWFGNVRRRISNLKMLLKVALWFPLLEIGLSNETHLIPMLELIIWPFFLFNSNWELCRGKERCQPWINWWKCKLFYFFC